MTTNWIETLVCLLIQNMIVLFSFSPIFLLFVFRMNHSAAILFQWRTSRCCSFAMLLSNRVHWCSCWCGHWLWVSGESKVGFWVFASSTLLSGLWSVCDRCTLGTLCKWPMDGIGSHAWSLGGYSLSGYRTSRIRLMRSTASGEILVGIVYWLRMIFLRMAT